MKKLKYIIVFIIVSLLVITIFSGSNGQDSAVKEIYVEKVPVKVAVFLYRANDSYISLVKQSLEDIQKENEGKVEFTFFDGKGNQSIENESIVKAIDKRFDLFIINLVDTKLSSVQDTFNKVTEKKIPFIIQGIAADEIINFAKNNYRTVFIASNTEQAGYLEGKIIVDAWNSNKNSIDKNKDNILQYVLLNGRMNNPGATDRTKYSLLTINDGGIKTEQLSSKFCNWERDCARTSIESLILSYGDKIEAIISNNDAMAIGAVEALQKYGYNKGDITKNILVVGIDALPEARELVNKGFMTGTVIQDPRTEADALYTVGLNMINGRNPIDGTNYKFDDSGIIIRLPYYEYVKSGN